ncbi:MAG: efflux RND transporter periplasmic adaptor subunit [Nodularia sp. (in: Bacteria)]|nr:MAG: efflux RND transporter periplasmic adaptor subunit [Nodularia sp. (in: cyanobacteria)]
MNFNIWQPKQSSSKVSIDIDQTEIDTSPPEDIEARTTKNSRLLQRPNWQYFLLGFAILAGSVITYQILPKDTQEVETAVTEIARLPVRASKVEIQPLQQFVFGNGRASAVQGKHLTFETTGTITYIKTIDGRRLREGDRVRQGELLARVDDRRLQADLTQSQARTTEAETQRVAAQASIFQAEANVEQAKADVVKATAELQAAKDTRSLAASEFKRREELFAAGAISESDVDVYQNRVQDADARVQAAEAQLNASQSRVKSAQGQLASTQAQLTASQASIQSATASQNRSQVSLEDSVIRAPFDGIIAHMNIREGDYWTPQRVRITGDYQSVVETVPMIIIDPSEYEVSARLPAFDGSLVATGQAAYVVSDQDMSAASTRGMTQADLFRLARARGRVFSVSPSITPGERAIAVSVRLTEGINNIRDGERVSVWIVVEENPNALAVPPNAIVYREQKPHVFVIDTVENVVHERPITEGIRGISLQEIKAGVKEGELVVTEGTNRLVNGTPIEIIDP